MSQNRLGSGLKTVEVPLQFLPTFNFLQKHRIVYFHRLLIRVGSGSVLRIIAITSSGELGMFHIDGQRKGNLNISNDFETLTYDHKHIFIGVGPNVDCEQNDGIVTLDFDTSSANVRGNETSDSAIKKLLQVFQHFLLGTGVAIHREGQPAPLPDVAGIPRVSEAKLAADAALADASARQQKKAAASSGGGGGGTSAAPLQLGGGSISSICPGDTPTNSKSKASQQNIASLRRKSQGSTFQKLFAGFSGVWGKDRDAVTGAGGAGGASAMPGGGGGAATSSPRFGERGEEDSSDSTVSVENHEKQRKRMTKWTDEVASRVGERDGLDAKERMLDQLSHLEATVKAQQALYQKGPKANPEEELKQQRALSALVMFVCRRQEMLADAKKNRIPLVKPKTVKYETVPNSVPVLPSYTDAVRSQLLG